MTTIALLCTILPLWLGFFVFVFVAIHLVLFTKTVLGYLTLWSDYLSAKEFKK